LNFSVLKQKQHRITNLKNKKMEIKMRKLLVSVMCSVMMLGIGAVAGATTTVVSNYQGWVESNGVTNFAGMGNNTFTGVDLGSVKNSWAGFDLSSVAAGVTSAELKIFYRPYVANQNYDLKIFDVTPNPLIPGGQGTVTITLDGPAPAGGFPVTVTSNPQIPGLPGSFTIPADSKTGTFTFTVPVVAIDIGAGKNSGTFNVATYQTGTTQNVTLTGTAAGVAKAGSLKVQQTTAVISKFDIWGVNQETNWLGGRLIYTNEKGVATITLAEPAPVGGCTLTLQSTSSLLDGRAFFMPATIVIPAGQSTYTFNFTTSVGSQLGAYMVATPKYGAAFASNRLTVSSL
jgi:hypothetical protein